MTNERKIQVLAEMDGFKIEAIDGGKYHHFIAPDGKKYGPASMYDYLHSYDAIIPAIIKWCGDNNNRWELFFIASTGTLVYGNTVTRFTQLYKKTAEQLADSLIKAAGKWED